MKLVPLQVSALALATAIGVSACSSSGDNGAVFGDAGAAGSISRASGMTTAESMATGAPAGSMISATVFVIAKHEASERQRKVAEERAHVTYSHMQAEKKHERTAHPVAQKHERKIPRYIAVDTVRDEHTSPQAKKAVMIWDTQSEQVVGNDVYDVQTPPAVGSTARFETYSAQYVGTGL